MASSRRTLEIRFPVDGAELRLGRSGAAPLIVAGGKPPYRWLINGAVAPDQQSAGFGARSQALWRPEGAGYHDLVAVDADGASARVRVYVGAARGAP